MIKIKETNVTVMVVDMDKAIQFYKSIGLDLKQRWDNNYAMLTAPGLTIGLHLTKEKNNNSGTVSIGLMIDSIEEAEASLDKNKIAHDPTIIGGSGDYIYFTDLDGTVLYFVKPKWR